MLLQQRTDALDRCGIAQAHFDHRMRVAQRHRGKPHARALQRQQVFLTGLGEAHQRHVGRFECRHAHGHRELAIAQHLHFMAGQRAVDDERIALRTALAHQPRGNAARAVAALLGVGTVGIPDPPTPVWRSARRAASSGVGGAVPCHPARAAESDDYTPVRTAANDPAVIIYTSGTTGKPKGARHAHRVLLGHLPGVEMSHEFFPENAKLMWTPADWAWIGGLLDVLLPSTAPPPWN
ncbi:hypothetical protein G6F63_013303 [Rhizopus arrhizus]|nr:hypothetical protein G6F63_013303 [Rhizopus arrhizus]